MMKPCLNCCQNSLTFRGRCSKTFGGRRPPKVGLLSPEGGNHPCDNTLELAYLLSNSASFSHVLYFYAECVNSLHQFVRICISLFI